MLVIKYQKSLERIAAATETGWDVDIERRFIEDRKFQYNQAVETIRRADADDLNRAGWLFKIHPKAASTVARALRQTKLEQTRRVKREEP